MNSNVKSIWNQIKVNGIDDADGDVVEAGVIEFGIIADEMFFTVLLAFLEYKFSYVHIQSRIPTVKLKIPGKAFLKSESRISVKRVFHIFSW